MEAQSHTFMGLDNGKNLVILLARVVVSYKQECAQSTGYLLSQACKERLWLSEVDLTIAVDLDVKP